MALVLDTGALLALERGSRKVAGLLDEAQRDKIPIRTTSAVVAQAWRDGARQARLARSLATLREYPLDQQRARKVGQLLARAKTADVVDGALVELLVDGDDVVTSDVSDIVHLARTAGVVVTVIPI